MMGSKALKLDSSYRPVEIIESIEALVLCLIGKARAIENHKEEVRTVSESFKLPSVIALNRYVKFRFSYMACNRTNLLWRDQNQCQYCSKTFEPKVLTLDHVLPKSRGGDNSWENLVIACKRCNQKKGNRTSSESGMHPIRKPYRPKSTVLKYIKKEQIEPVWKNYIWEFNVAP